MNSLLRILHKQPGRCYDLKFSSDPRNMKDLRLKLNSFIFLKRNLRKKNYKFVVEFSRLLDTKNKVHLIKYKSKILNINLKFGNRKTINGI